MMLGIVNWVFTVADSYSLQGIIRFAGDGERNRKINFISRKLYISLLGLSLLLWAIGALITYFVSTEDLLSLIIYIPLILIVNAPRIYLIKIFMREMRYEHITICNLLLYGIFVALLGWDISVYGSIGAERMLAYFTIGTLASSVYCILFGYRYSKTEKITDNSFYKEYSLPVSVQSLLNTSIRQLDVVLLGAITGTAAAGVYGLCKHIFKFFEEAGMAAAALFNPAIVRQIAKDKKDAILPLLEKVNAYMFALFAVGLIAIWSGLLDWIMLAVFDNPDIADALEILELMAVAGVFLPLFVLSFIFNAEGEEKKLLSYNLLAAIVAAVVFVIFASTGQVQYFSLGLVAYYAIIAFYTYSYIRKRYGFQFSSVLRLGRDIKGMIDSR